MAELEPDSTPGPEPIVVLGAVRSTVHVYVFPGWGRCCRSRPSLVPRRCVSPRRGRCSRVGSLQPPKVPPSSLHSKLEPGSLDVKAKLALWEFVGDDEPR